MFGESKGLTPFNKLIEDNGALFEPDNSIDPMNDPVMLPYSSGTTGIPKGNKFHLVYRTFRKNKVISCYLLISLLEYYFINLC